MASRFSREKKNTVGKVGLVRSGKVRSIITIILARSSLAKLDQNCSDQIRSGQLILIRFGQVDQLVQIRYGEVGQVRAV